MKSTRAIFRSQHEGYNRDFNLHSLSNSKYFKIFNGPRHLLFSLSFPLSQHHSSHFHSVSSSSNHSFDCTIALRMPVFSSNTESAMSAIRSRFGFGQTQHPEPADSATPILKSSASSPDLLMKSVRRGNSASDDSETTSGAASRSFEFGLDPNFWKEHNVQVIIRLRPLSSSEISVQGPSRCVKQESSQTITWTGYPESRFTFDIVADESVSQEMLFKVAGVPMVENCMLGYNSCMFAYGQTGSGKTHTMLGDIEGGTRRHSVNCGMTPRVFEYLFSRIQKDKDARREEKVKFTCRCSFIEIYNEQILDLLDPSSANLQIREDTNKGIYVENATEVEVTSARDVIQHLIQGSTNRKVAATNMNHASSRSHSVFTCVIESKWESEGVTRHRFARLNLVDLAGSERQKSSGAEGERLREATNINKSLSTLGLVIMNLVSTSNGRTPHVPYRDSKLTFLLQDSLGGNAKTIIIANISPSSCCSLETLSTLKFAQRAKFIKNHAIVNEDASGDVLALRLENQNLKKEVTRLRSLVHGGAEIDGDYSIKFPGSPGTFKWDGEQGFSSPIVSQKKISHKKEYEVALVGALQRENDKDQSLQALAAENQAVLRLAKQREDEIQGLKMRLRFREAGIKRLESVASGKMSAETHLLKEREEHLKEIEVFRAQVERNQDVTRFAMENLRLKEEIRRLKSFCEEGEQERLNEQISVLEKELREALDWKLMHASDCAITQKESRDLVLGAPTDSNFLTSNQDCTSPWRTSMSEENEFLRMQAIQNQSEIDGLHRKIDFLVDEKEKLEMHINELAKELEAERLSKEAMIANEALKQETKFSSSLMNIGASDQTELKTMVEAIGAASEREAEAHEMAVSLSKENDELKVKLRVLIEDNNKLIDLYEKAVAENRAKSSDSSEIPWQDDGIAKVDEAKGVEEKEFEKLNCQLTEMHEENDKLLSLYEKAMLERDELKKVIASSQNKNAHDKESDSCPEKLVEIDEGQCLIFGEASDFFETEHEAEDLNSNRLNVDDGNTDLDVESSLYEVHVEDDCNLCSPKHTDSNEANMESFTGVGNNDVAELIVQNAMEIDEPKKSEEQYERCITIPMHVHKDLKSIRMKLAEAQDKLSDSAETVSIFGSFERAIVEVDALSEKIGKLECSKEAKKQECQRLQVLSLELHERKELANNKLWALKHSLTNFSSSLSYFEQRATEARSRFDASSQNLNRKKEELISLQSSKQELLHLLSNTKHTEDELRSAVKNLRMKVEEENQKLESDRVLFAIDNVDKPATDLCNKSWQVTGKATALLKSEEEKTKLQNQIKLNSEKLGDVRKQCDAMNKKLAKMGSEIQLLEAEVEKETCAVEEMNLKAENSLQEKEMLLEVKENGEQEFESMLLEYHQRLFEAELKEEEIKMARDEVMRESREVEGLQIARDEVALRKKQFVEALSCDSNACLVSDKVEAALRSLQTSVVELNSLLQQIC